MWYEILPPLFLVGAALAFPTLFGCATHKLLYGTIYRRDFRTARKKMMFLRDERISGKGYRAVGLENLPDEPVLLKK